VVNVTVEADAFCGPLLAQRAAIAGVLYSLAFGDQPALICDLVDWARTCGFPVVAGGRGHKWLPHFCESTPETVWGHYGLTPEQAVCEVLDGEGGYTVWGKLLPSATSLAMGGLPLGLAHGPKVVRAVKKGQSLSWSDVAMDQDTAAYKVRREMESMFAKTGTARV
jgi:predicted homoserine dehydrogenase-like protein